jgi:hypothetical protein
VDVPNDLREGDDVAEEDVDEDPEDAEGED